MDGTQQHNWSPSSIYQFVLSHLTPSFRLFFSLGPSQGQTAFQFTVKCVRKSNRFFSFDYRCGDTHGMVDKPRLSADQQFYIFVCFHSFLLSSSISHTHSFPAQIDIRLCSECLYSLAYVYGMCQTPVQILPSDKRVGSRLKPRGDNVCWGC